MTTLSQRLFSAAREGRLWSGMRRWLIDYYFLRKSRGVIYIGANDLAERDMYAMYGLKVIWIEPVPEVFQRLVENIRDFPNQRAINALITNEDGALCTLHVSNNSGLSSLTEYLHLHKDIWPGVTLDLLHNLANRVRCQPPLPTSILHSMMRWLSIHRVQSF